MRGWEFGLIRTEALRQTRLIYSHRSGAYRIKRVENLIWTTQIGEHFCSRESWSGREERLKNTPNPISVESVLYRSVPFGSVKAKLLLLSLPSAIKVIYDNQLNGGMRQGSRVARGQVWVRSGRVSVRKWAIREWHTTGSHQRTSRLYFLRLGPASKNRQAHLVIHGGARILHSRVSSWCVASPGRGRMAFRLQPFRPGFPRSLIWRPVWRQLE